ncbi:MAG: type IX secretion system membrane protein PorP/SprF [Flavobacteriaceae bacterium]|nr:type IX secretion system membrane protein PorP/SprF [Flavobacteriaceae bacterium]
MKSISKLSVLVAFFTVKIALAQQSPNFTLYNFNMNIINPAYAGSNDMKEINLSYRSQWLGIDNAPSTQTFSFSKPLHDNLGFGLSIINDKVFVLSQRDVTIDLSYRLKVSESHDLFFGAKVGGGFVNIDLNDSGAPGFDPLFTSNQSFFNPHFGAGFYLKHKKYYITLSTPNFLNGKRYKKIGNLPRAAITNSHVYFGGGYIFSLSKNYQLTPAFMTVNVNGAPTSYDISCTLKMYEKFSLGTNLRLDEMTSIYSLIQVTNKLKFGIAYDFTTSDVNIVGEDNSLELILKYKF